MPSQRMHSIRAHRVKITDHRHSRLLGPRLHWPRRCRAAEDRYELAPSHPEIPKRELAFAKRGHTLAQLPSGGLRRQRTNRETWRGGFQTRPLSADAARVMLSGSYTTAQDYSRCKRECDPTRLGMTMNASTARCSA